MSEVFFIQVLGLIAASFSVVSFLCKNDKHFKVYSFIALSVFALHFFMLAAYAGMVAMIIAAIRNLLSIKYFGSKKLMWFIIAIYCSMIFWFIDDIAGLLIIFSGIVNTYAVYQLSGIKMRLITFVSSCAWIVYGILHQSLGGVLAELFLQAINISTMWRIMKDKTRQKALLDKKSVSL